MRSRRPGPDESDRTADLLRPLRQADLPGLRSRRSIEYHFDAISRVPFVHSSISPLEASRNLRPVRSAGWPRHALRVFCIAYLLLLFCSLLSTNPAKLLGTYAGIWESLSARVLPVHFLAFAALALLALASPWGAPRWVVVAGLIGCALGTEYLQQFVPGRTPELVDFFQNLAGIAAGAIVCRLSVPAPAKAPEKMGGRFPAAG